MTAPSEEACVFRSYDGRYYHTCPRCTGYWVDRLENATTFTRKQSLLIADWIPEGFPQPINPRNRG